jgi:cobalt-zinc-cadmium efflux system protein
MSQQKRLALVLFLNIAMIMGLIIVGLSSRSLSVLAAAVDFAADSIAIGLGILAISISHHPHGNPKAIPIVALLNSIVLVLVTASVIYSAIHRLFTSTPQIDGLSVMRVSIVATIIMFICALILGRDAGKEDLHMRSVLLDTIADGASAAAVAITGGIIFLTGGFYWLDSAITLVISVVIVFSAVRLLRDVLKELGFLLAE